MVESDPSTSLGLTGARAAELLERHGPNALPDDENSGVLQVVLGVLREPMLLLLLVAGGLYFSLGELREALVLCSAIGVIIFITLAQERRTQKALSALRGLTSPRARVLRDGIERRVPAGELVVQDIVRIAEGDRVPADGYLIEGANLKADEALLTGESVAVRKVASPERPTDAPPGGDDLPWVYSGSLVVSGQGLMEVTATGVQTEVGKIGRSLAELDVGRTPLQKQVGRLVWGIGGLAVVVCATVVVTLGLTRGDWIEALLAGIALGMSLLPEEFPVVLTVFLALGAWRLSRVRVLTRRMPALETLGSATILCSDKTGTLTENRMTIAALHTAAGDLDIAAGAALPEDFHDVIEFGILASQRDPFDPMEVAFKALGAETLAGTEHLHGDWSLEREYPLSAELLAMSHVWSSGEGDRLVIASKGAPESISDLCHLTDAQTQAVDEDASRMAARGMRVLGVARAYFSNGALPDHQHAFDFEWLGLVGLEDPVREHAAEAVEACYAAGIRVMMITGDYAQTATAIGKQLGLTARGETRSGAELAALATRGGHALREALGRTTIVARAVPEHKLRIVEALESAGEVVAMTGDGVNDAPALKAAEIGVAMGGRGTDVAREAAEIVVTDDDFSSIVEGVKMGRRIQDNLRRALAFIVAVHVPIAGLALLPLAAGGPLMLLPVHIAFLELIIDPACSIAFEAEPADEDIMRRPPIPPGVPLFGLRLVGWSVLQGLGVLLAVGLIYFWAQSQGLGAGQTRAMTFACLITGNVGLILINRSWTKPFIATLRRRNVAFALVVVGATVFLAASLLVPWLRGLFLFEAVGASRLGLAVLAGGLSVSWFELFKLVAPTRVVAAR